MTSHIRDLRMSSNSQERFKNIHNMFENTDKTDLKLHHNDSSQMSNALADRINHFNKDSNNNAPLDKPGMLPKPPKVSPKPSFNTPKAQQGQLANEESGSQEKEDSTNLPVVKEMSKKTKEGQENEENSEETSFVRTEKPPLVKPKPKPEARTPGKLNLKQFQNVSESVLSRDSKDSGIIPPRKEVKPLPTKKTMNLPGILKEQNVQDSKPKPPETKPKWKTNAKFDVSNVIASEISKLSLLKVSSPDSHLDEDDSSSGHSCGLSPPNKLVSPPPISHPVIVTRPSDGAKFKKLKFVPGEGDIPVKPEEMYVDLTLVIAQYKELTQLSSSSDHTDSDVPPTPLQSAPVIPMRPAPRPPSAERPVSMIPDMTEDEEMQAGANKMSPITDEAEEEYIDCQTFVQEPDDIYEFLEDEGSTEKVESEEEQFEPIEPPKSEKELEKERKKKEKEEAERKKKEEKKKQEEEKKRLEDEKKRVAEESKIKKLFKLTGEEKEETTGQAKIDIKGSKFDLALKKGQQISIMRTIKNPPGKYLCQTEEKKWGYVSTQNLTIDCDALREVADKSKANGSISTVNDGDEFTEDDAEEIYEEVGTVG